MEFSAILNSFVDWIDAHGTTIDLLKWITIGLIAWALGVFRFIRTKLKRPKLEIEPLTSRCIWEEMGVIDGNPDNAKVVFLIDAGITNPTTEPVSIRDFTLKIKRLKGWPVKNHPLNAVTLPSRVRQTTGNVTKLLKNWFSHFAEGSESLTLNGRIEPKEHQSGFLLFVSASWGYMRPLVKNGAIPIRLCVRLTTGERLYIATSIAILADNSRFDEMVPGLRDYVKERNTWNVIRE